MRTDHKMAMGDLPRTHANCKERTGVFRPGKTAQDRARKRGMEPVQEVADTKKEAIF